MVLSELKKNHLTAEGPQTLAEKRAIEIERKDLERVKKSGLRKKPWLFPIIFNIRYFPESKINKNWRSYAREDSLFRLWIEPVIGKMPFKDIRPFHLERIKKNMADAGKAPRSIQYALAVVRQVFNHAIKNEVYSGDNPARKVASQRSTINGSGFSPMRKPIYC